MSAICTGCGINSSELAEYNEDNPIKEDGTYSNNCFVCNTCYCRLIYLGLDIGDPKTLQERARTMKSSEVA